MRLVSAILFVLAAGPGLAQTVIEEVIVTAQKRAQAAQDVGITISVFSGDELGKLNIRHEAEVVANIPNVQVNYGFGQNAFNIRGLGINEFSANLDSPVAVHVDEVYMSKNFMTTLLLFDIDQVEALKGPQGTLFGRNTTGGSINFSTRKPTEELTAGVTVGFDNYEMLRGEFFAGGALGENLRGRLSGFVTDQGEGFYENLTRNEDEGAEKKHALRGQLAWSNDSTEVLASAHFGEDTSTQPPYEGVGVFTPASLAAGAPVFCAEYLDGTVTGATANCVRGTDGLNPGDNDPFTSNGTYSHKANNSAAGGMLRIDHDFDSVILTSISGYENFQRDLREDSDGTPGPGIGVFWNNEITQYTQELRLTSHGDERWNYVLGAFYEHDKYENADYLTVFEGAFPGLFTEFTQETDAAAAFFHNDFAVSDTVNLTAGVRYTWEQVSIDGGTVAGTGITSIGDREQPDTVLVTTSTSSALADGGNRDDTDTSFKIGVEWQPVVQSTAINDLMLFFNVSTAFRSGGYNAEFAGSQAAFTSLDPENITAYEGGFKSTFAGRTVQINGAVFYYDFRDGFVNVDNPTSPVPITINAANIEVLGAEFDLQWLPVDGLSVAAGLGWLDAEITSDITTAGISLKGNSPVNSPDMTFNTEIRYEYPLAGGWRFAIGGDANYRSSQYLETVNAPSNLEDAYWVVNGQVGFLSGDDRWSLTLWGRNLTDSAYRTYVNDLPAFGWLLNIYGAPRTYGVTASVKF
jgi:iron complex outermembrane receptor protein